MAPVCLSACRLSRQFLNIRSALCLSMLSLLLLMRCVDAIITYDPQALLHIKSLLDNQSRDCPIAQEYCYCSFSRPSAVFVRQLPCCIIHQRKCRRRRGNCVRIRRDVSISSAHLSTCPFTPSYGHRGLYLARRSWDVRYACHLPIIPDRRQSDEFCAPARLCVRNRGVNLRNIKSLKYVRQSQTQTVVSHVKMALVNARSVSNKTFILNDFFTSHELDFLFLTETWTGRPSLANFVL